MTNNNPDSGDKEAMPEKNLTGFSTKRKIDASMPHGENTALEAMAQMKLSPFRAIAPNNNPDSGDKEAMPISTPENSAIVKCAWELVSLLQQTAPQGTELYSVSVFDVSDFYVMARTRQIEAHPNADATYYIYLSDRPGWRLMRSEGRADA